MGVAERYGEVVGANHVDAHGLHGNRVLAVVCANSVAHERGQIDAQTSNEMAEPKIGSSLGSLLCVARAFVAEGGEESCERFLDVFRVRIAHGIPAGSALALVTRRVYSAVPGLDPWRFRSPEVCAGRVTLSPVVTALGHFPREIEVASPVEVGMSLDVEMDAPPIETLAELVEWFRAGEKDATSLLVGVEHEKLGYHRDSLAPATYDGAIGPILHRMQKFGWVAPEGESVIISLSRGDEAISLEPGGQFELAGGPRKTLHEANADLLTHITEVQEVAADLNVGFSWIGLRPFDAPEDLSWMPKGRYRKMYSFLKDKGRRVLDMMLASATVQANFDYVSEADMVDKMRCSMAVSPIIAAMFCNSPYLRGVWDGRRSTRYAAWREVDPARCGLLHLVFDDDFGYEKYLEHVIDLPVIFFRRGGEYLDLEGRTFRHIIENGALGHRANIGDFISQLSAFFPEVRLKRFLEVRSADTCEPGLAMALVALWKGILYDDQARAEIQALLGKRSVGEREAMQIAVAQDGLHARGVDWHALELAREVERIARQGLRRQGCLNDAGEDETILLAPLEPILTSGMTPADRLLSCYGPGPFDEATKRKMLREAEAL